MSRDTDDSSPAAHVPSEQEVAQNPRMLAMASIRVQPDGDGDDDTGAGDQLALQTETDSPRVLTDGLDKTLVRVTVDGV